LDKKFVSTRPPEFDYLINYVSHLLPPHNPSSSYPLHDAFGSLLHSPLSIPSCHNSKQITTRASSETSRSQISNIKNENPIATLPHHQR
jgi:hypothetical protein